MRVAINLASRPFADVAPALRNLRLSMGALALVAALLGLGLHFLHDKAEAARARTHSLDDKIAALTRERQQYQAMMQQPDNAGTLRQSESLNQLFDEKAFSWTLAMEDLETVLPAGVQVTTLEPSIKNGLITVQLRVVGPRNRDVELVQNLEHSRHFLLPRIVNETSAAEAGPNQRAEPVSDSNRVNFDMLADYTPGSPAERRLVHEKATSRGKGQDSSASHGDGAPGRRPYIGMGRPRTPLQPAPGRPQ